MARMIGACLCFALSWVAAFAQAPDATRFQGTWQLDKTQGLLPRGGAGAADIQLTITASDITLQVKRCCGFGPVRGSQNTYVLDGAPHEYTRNSDTVPQATAVRTSRWLLDADGFEVVESNNRQRWTVSTDGNSLSVETTVHRLCPPCGPPNPEIDRTIEVFVKRQ